MRSTMRVCSPKERTEARKAGERQARTVFVQLICCVSILRTALTRVLPLAGCSTWWLTMVCLLPGMAVFLLLALATRLTRTATLTEMIRQCLGRAGAWTVSLLLAALLILDGIASITVLITVFTEGIGTRGTQLTLAVLTGGVLLTSLHREGLARGTYLLRRVLLGAALLMAAFILPAVRTDALFPMLGDGRAALTDALGAGISLAWPLVLLLTIPEEGAELRTPSLCPVVLVVLTTLLILCLTLPHELLVRTHTLAGCLLLPARYASSAVRTLAHCLLMLTFFLSVGGAAQLTTDFFCAPLGDPPVWLPYAVLVLITGTQALRTEALWEALGAAEPLLLLPLAGLAALCLPIAIIRRDRT